MAQSKFKKGKEFVDWETLLPNHITREGSRVLNLLLSEGLIDVHRVGSVYDLCKREMTKNTKRQLPARPLQNPLDLSKIPPRLPDLIEDYLCSVCLGYPEEDAIMVYSPSCVILNDGGLHIPHVYHSSCAQHLKHCAMGKGSCAGFNVKDH